MYVVLTKTYRRLQYVYKVFQFMKLHFVFIPCNSRESVVVPKYLPGVTQHKKLNVMCPDTLCLVLYFYIPMFVFSLPTQKAGYRYIDFKCAATMY